MPDAANGACPEGRRYVYTVRVVDEHTGLRVEREFTLERSENPAPYVLGAVRVLDDLLESIATAESLVDTLAGLDDAQLTQLYRSAVTRGDRVASVYAAEKRRRGQRVRAPRGKAVVE